MPLNLRSSKKYKNFDIPVSFKVNETGDKFRDALNIFSNQGKAETRFGRSRFNSTPLGSTVQSLSFFEDSNNNRFLIAKTDTSICTVSKTDEHTVLKSDLSPETKHRGLTWSRGSSSRHIIALGEDGLVQFDGNALFPLGQDPPGAPEVTVVNGTLANGTYQVGLTFYSSKTGFETNIGNLSGNATVANNNQGIEVTDIPAIAENLTIDKVRVYLKKFDSVEDPVFVEEIDLGETTFSILSTPASQINPPKANAKPMAGGAKFVTSFNRKLVYAGSSFYKNDIFFSEEDLPDAFNDGSVPGRLVLYATLDGVVTGLATGLYNNSVLDPFLVVFKKRSTHIYSEIGGQPKFVPISAEIGCVSHDTIIVKNGMVYFLSEQGWRVIVNGSLLSDKIGNPITLGNGDIDDIFRSPGYNYEINQTLLENSFSVFYSTLDQYMTWVAEGARTDFSKTYVYEYRVGGFKPYEFLSASTCACIGIENGQEVVYMGDASGFVYGHSTREERADEDESAAKKAINSFGVIAWIDGGDMDSSYNFRELIVRRMAGTGDLIVRASVNYDFDESSEYILRNELSGFILDVSQMDVDEFGASGRSIITRRADINRVGENLMLGFYVNGVNANLALVSAQVDFSKNGNRN